MSIRYEPSKLVKKLRLKDRAADLVTPNLALNRSAVKSLTEFGVLPKKVLEDVSLKVIKQYKEKAKELRKEGATKAEAIEEASNGAKQMQARVQSAALYEQTKVIQRAYRGEYYKWLPSTANEPRVEHEKNYNKIFQLGVGDDDGNDPGDLYGCQCGMEILTDDDADEFNERLEDAL
jgi:hypothetical protein